MLKNNIVVHLQKKKDSEFQQTIIKTQAPEQGTLR